MLKKQINESIKMQKLITIITPTYNRKEKLKKLYRSLTQQSSYNFDWLVVDDGSTDKTDKLIQKYINENQFFHIDYLQEDNGGKHRALNLGISKIKSKLTFIVDSDDILTSDAIASIEKAYEKNKSRSDFGGLAFLKANDKNELLINKLPQNGSYASYVEERLGKNIKGDMAEIWITELLRENPFPEFKDEKFLSEDIVWMKISGKRKLYFVNQIIYKANYLADGLTQNRRKNNWNAPRGCMYKGLLLVTLKSIPIKSRFKGGFYFNVYGYSLKYSSRQLITRSNQNLFVMLTLLPSKLIYINWKRKYSR